MESMIMVILSWVVLGLIVGGIARLLVPGPQPMSWFNTGLLGVTGALIGGLVGWVITGRAAEPFANYAWPGWLLAIIGAVVILLISRRHKGLPH